MTKIKLLEPYKTTYLQLNNRVVMAPLTRRRAQQDGSPTKLNATYYQQRAGAGLIIA